MCKNDIIAFGMNGMEIALTLAALASLFGLAVFTFMYLNGHLGNKKIDLIDIDLYSKEELKNIRKYGR